MAVDVTLSVIKTYASTCCKRAKAVADAKAFPGPVRKAFSEKRSAMLSNSAYAAEHYSLTDDPEIGELDHFDGVMAWGAFLSFDLQKSTSRARRLGARATYITMHTLLPTLLEVIRQGDGTVVGLRGDGAMAMFGKIDCKTAEDKLDPALTEEAVSRACDCAQALAVAVHSAVNPALAESAIEAGLNIGVGVDCGIFIATKIGIERSYELTAYGECVNWACKLADHGKNANRVVISNDIRKLFPVSPGGKTAIVKVPGAVEGYYLTYPAGYKSFK